MRVAFALVTQLYKAAGGVDVGVKDASRLNLVAASPSTCVARDHRVCRSSGAARDPSRPTVLVILRGCHCHPPAEPVRDSGRRDPLPQRTLPMPQSISLSRHNADQTEAPRLPMTR